MSVVCVCVYLQSALGWDHQSELSKHGSQTDAKKGFGGQFGVQKDRQDKVNTVWNLWIMDTLGPVILSFIERLSSLQRLKCTSIIEKGLKVCPLYVREYFFYCVLYQRFYCRPCHALVSSRCMLCLCASFVPIPRVIVCVPFQSALGWDHQTQLSAHASQTDAKKGFGGRFGVQTDRQDEVSFDKHDYYLSCTVT